MYSRDENRVGLIGEVDKSAVVIEQVSALKKRNDDEINDFPPQQNRKSVLNQIIITGAVLILTAGCGMPIGYSNILIPQLLINNNGTEAQNETMDPMSFDWNVASWITSIHSAASPIGSFLSGPVMDRWGRRTALLIAIIPLILGWIVIALSNSHIILIVGRILAGGAVGIIAAPAQILIAEIAVPDIRGLLVGTPFAAYSLGILFVYYLGSHLQWRAVAWCGIILPVISWIAIWFCPETPTWLVRNNKEHIAFDVLKRLRQSPKHAKGELQDLVDRCEEERKDDKKTSVWRSLKQAHVLKPVIIVNLFNTFQVMSGTYIVVFYAVNIIQEFTHDNLGLDPLTAAVLSAVTRLVITIIYCFLLHYMRRRLMLNLMGSGSAISCFVIAILLFYKDSLQPEPLVIIGAILIVIYILTNTAFFVMPGIMAGEILPSKIRGRIAGYIFSYFNILLFTLAKVFPYVEQAIGIKGIFIIFGVASVISTFICYLMFPETKGKTLSEIEDYFKETNWFWVTRKTSVTKST